MDGMRYVPESRIGDRSKSCERSREFGCEIEMRTASEKGKAASTTGGCAGTTPTGALGWDSWHTALNVRVVKATAKGGSRQTQVPMLHACKSLDDAASEGNVHVYCNDTHAWAMLRSVL